MHFIHGLNTGGAETLVKEYAVKLKRRNYDVVILCFSHYYDSPYEKFLNDMNVRVLYVCDYMKFFGRKNIFFKIFNYFQKYFVVKRIILEEKPDILHTHLPINRYVKKAKPNKKIKIFHTVHSNPSVLWPNSKDEEYRAAKWLVDNYDMRFICLHDEMKNEVNKLFDVNNSIVINNGIDFSRFEKTFDKEKIRKKLGIDVSSFVVGHVGRFSKAKNHMFLIDIFNEIYKKNNDAFLLLIGDGEEKECVVNRLDELNLGGNYLILNNRNDIPDLLSIMNVFVFPSIYEGLPISLIEAQKMYLPCFISNIISNKVIISNFVSRLSLQSSKYEWAKAVLEYKNPKEMIIDDDEWDMENVINKLEDVYLGRE